MLGLSLLHLAVEGRTPEFRRIVVTVLSEFTPEHPELLNEVVSSALDAYLRRDKLTPKVNQVGEDTSLSVKNQESKLSSLLLTCAAFGDSIDRALRESSLIRLIILGHHPAVCEYPFQIHLSLY